MHSAAPPDAPGTWEAATDPVDMTDHSIELPALAPMPRHHAARIGRAALVLVLVLGCAGAAVAFSGVLEKRPDAAAPPDAVGDASVVAPVRTHHARAKPKPKPNPIHRHKARHRQHRHAKVAPREVVAAAPAPAANPAPIQTTASAPAPVRHVSSSPAPTSTPSRPTNTTTTTAAPQPAASAPSGEPGRQPPSQP